ncbi:MAG: DNA-3-methyladenine glycosylase, partial [Acidobacteria bacterium]|nr:DNA-3-methyladenine glycosylase [Acidobacteriota bacterium]
MNKLPRSFYQGRDTVTIARDLLGCIVWRRIGRELLAA